MNRRKWLVTIAAWVCVVAEGQPLSVAAKDSSEAARTAARFVCDGEGDQEEITAAIASLPEAGGTVQLAAGTYDIRKVEGRLGGVLIERSRVTLAGEGAGTKLVQAPGQNTNVIRIIGAGVGHIVIRDLYVDANREQNAEGQGDPNVSHARFEFCGIKAFAQEPGGSGAEPIHDVTIDNCHVVNAHSLGIMLEGSNMRVLNNFLGNANSDVVEILTGPGEIRGNYIEITGRTHVAVGSDRADSMIMADNIVRVKDGGDLDIGFRSWAGSRRHVIANNVLVVDQGGRCKYAMDIRGLGAAVTGNSIDGTNVEGRLPLWVTGGNTVLTGNLLENVAVVVEDKTDAGKPIRIEHNLMDGSVVVHKNGDLKTDATVEKP